MEYRLLPTKKLSRQDVALAAARGPQERYASTAPLRKTCSRPHGLAEAGAVIKFEGRVLIDEHRMLEALRRGSQRPGVLKPRRGRPRAA